MGKWEYTITSYAIAACLLAAAVWISWDWSWAAKGPVLVYLAIGAVFFPAARVPAEVVILTAMVWSPVHLTGLFAIVPRMLLYAAALLCWVVVVPLGAAMQFAKRRLAARRGPAEAE